MLRIKTVLRAPRFVVFNKFLKHKTPTYYETEFAVPSQVIKDTMSYKEYCDERKKLSKTIPSEPFLLNKTYSLIKDFLTKESKEPELLSKEILNETFFDREFNNWNLTNFMRKNDVHSRELFLSMVLDADPYGAGTLANITKSKEEILADFEKKVDGETVYFDWYNGIGIKNHFPVDHYQTGLELDIRRFNDRNYNNGYHKLLRVMEHYIKEEPKKFTRVEDSDPIDKSHVKPNVIDMKKVEYFNSMNPNESDCVIEKDYNWRCRLDSPSDSDYELKDTYDMDIFYDKYLKDVADSMDLSSYFDFEECFEKGMDRIFVPKFFTKLEE